MAKIRVYRDERKGGLFPERCLRCGKEPVEERTKQFVWNPGWAHLFIFLGLLPWLIALLITRKTMKMTVPLCSTHRNHWRNRQMYVWLGFSLLGRLCDHAGHRVERFSQGSRQCHARRPHLRRLHLASRRSLLCE